MSIVKDALDRARKDSGLRDRNSLLLFIVKSFLDGTVTSGGEARKPPYQILLHRQAFEIIDCVILAHDQVSD